MSLKKFFFKSNLSYRAYLYYNLYIRHKCFLNRKKYSQWGEDLEISNFFHNKLNGFYLDIGCFHPFMYSNTCLLHKKGWSGINVDINQTSIDLFNLARPKDINLCTTIDEKKRDFKVYFDDAFSPVNTINKDFYLKLRGSFFKDEKFLNIKSQTIDEIINVHHKNLDIDFINIDVEGSDYEILKQIDLLKLNVKLIAIETHPIDNIESDSVPQILNFLKKNNFTIFKRIGPTSLFKKQ